MARKRIEGKNPGVVWITIGGKHIPISGVKNLSEAKKQVRSNQAKAIGEWKTMSEKNKERREKPDIVTRFLQRRSTPILKKWGESMQGRKLKRVRESTKEDDAILKDMIRHSKKPINRG